MKPTYSLLIPAYNASKSITALMEETLSTTNGHKPDAIIVVDDGSGDDTADKATRFTPHVVRHSQNKGKGAALKSGFAYFLNNFSSTYLITLDADLQHPPNYITALIDHAVSNRQPVVVGQRSFTPPQMPLMRVLSNTITSQMISGMLGQSIPDSQCGFRLIHRDVLPLLNLRENGFQMESEFFFRCKEQNVNIGFCPIPTVYTPYGSSMHHVRDTFKFLKMIIKEARRI